MIKLPQYLMNFSLYVSGKGYAGKVEKITPPKLAYKTEEYRGSGMDAPIEIELGMEKLACQFTIHSYDAELFALWGLVPGNQVNIALRGCMTQGGVEKSVELMLQGSWKSFDMGEWVAGTKAGLMVEVSAQYYALSINKMPVILIDIRNHKRIIGGKDQLANMRQMLKL